MNPVFEWGLDFMQALQQAVGAVGVDLAQFFTFLGKMTRSAACFNPNGNVLSSRASWFWTSSSWARDPSSPSDGLPQLTRAV